MNKFLTVLVLGAVLVFVGFVYRGGDTKKENTTLGASGIATSSVVYFENVSGYLATPTKAGPHPAIILIHEWWGLNDDIKLLAERYAAAGYVALAVDMYKGTSTEDQAVARELVGAVRGDMDGAFANLRGAVSYLRSRPDVNGEQLASVGWCFGGGWSYQMAVNNLGTRASVMYYGQFDPADDFEHMKAHILGHFGETDTGIKVDTVTEFQAELKTANGAHEVYIYPNVGHGFANARGGTNAAYSAEAAELAWERTLTFLKTTFDSR